MTPETLIIDRSFRGVGRIKRATGTTNPAIRRKITRMLTALYDAGRTDILKAIRDGKLTLMEAHGAFQASGIDGLATGDTLSPLSETMQKWIASLSPGVDYSAKHIESLETSRRYFERESAKARISDLPDVLESLRNSLGGKHARSFNLARAAALAFVRANFKRSHQLWREISAVELRKVQPSQKKSPLSVKQMRGFFPSPETDHVDAIAWTMATTGMGASELWGRWHATADRVHIAGTKRGGRVRDVPLVIPPTVPKIHRRTLENALRERTNRAIVPYDLRRTFAHWLELALVPRSRRRRYMGHGAADVTDLYERHEVDAYIAADGVRLKALVEEKNVAEAEERTPAKPRRGVLVYFIQREGRQAVKIGIARDPLSRLSELQIGSAEALSLIGTLPGGREREREIHERFAHLRIRGEWFRTTPELRAWLKAELAAAHTKTHTTDVQPLFGQVNEG